MSKYGDLICSKSKFEYGKNKELRRLTNYRNKLKRENNFDELEIFNKKVGKKVSETILSNQSLRKKRGETLSRLNKTESFRRKASETAIQTSKRIDILESRSAALKRWREANPEKFAEILQNLHLRKTSRPEKLLLEYCKSINADFLGNQQLKHKFFKINKTKRRQLDVVSLKDKIIIEFDGSFHFENIKKWNQLEKVKLKDIELNSLVEDGWCIIRISNDQFCYKKSNYGFSENCLRRISLLISEKKIGLHLIGELYGSR